MIQIGNKNEARERKVYQVHLLHVAEQEAFQDVVDFFGVVTRHKRDAFTKVRRFCRRRSRRDVDADATTVTTLLSRIRYRTIFSDKTFCSVTK